MCKEYSDFELLELRWGRGGRDSDRHNSTLMDSNMNSNN